MAYHVEQNPFLWLLEGLLGLIAVLLIQLTAGLFVIFISRTIASFQTKLILTLFVLIALALLSRPIFDFHTHMQFGISTALSMTFTLPLQCISTLHLSHKSSADRPLRETLLRIAIPAAHPSASHPPESPKLQFLRAFVYLTLTVTIFGPRVVPVLFQRGIYPAVLRAGTILTGVTAILTFSSAMLGLLGARSPAPFRAPLFSPSLASFWANRWNVAVSDALRAGAYNPLRIAGVPSGVAVIVTFAVSGVAHETLLWYAGFEGSGGRWFAFFVTCGLLVNFERVAHPFLPKPGLWRWPFVLVGVVLPFEVLFVPVAVDTGLAERGIAGLSDGFSFVRAVHRALSKT